MFRVRNSETHNDDFAVHALPLMNEDGYHMMLHGPLHDAIEGRAVVKLDLSRTGPQIDVLCSASTTSAIYSRFIRSVWRFCHESQILTMKRAPV